MWNWCSFAKTQLTMNVCGFRQMLFTRWRQRVAATMIVCTFQFDLLVLVVISFHSTCLPRTPWLVSWLQVHLRQAALLKFWFSICALPHFKPIHTQWRCVRCAHSQSSKCVCIGDIYSTCGKYFAHVCSRRISMGFNHDDNWSGCMHLRAMYTNTGSDSE